MPRKTLFELGKTPVCWGRLRGVGKGQGRISGEAFSSPGKLDGRPGSLPFIQPIIQTLSPQPSACPFHELFGPCSLCQITGSTLFFLTSWQRSLFTQAWEVYLLRLRSPSSPLPLPALTKPGLTSVLSKLLRCSFCSSVEATDTETQPALTPSQRGTFAGKGILNRLFQSEAKSIRLICCMMFWRESHLVLPDDKWQSVALREKIVSTCFPASEINPTQTSPCHPYSPILEQIKLHNGAFNAERFPEWEDKGIYRI